jgi:hypothetical protein
MEHLCIRYVWKLWCQVMPKFLQLGAVSCSLEKNGTFVSCTPLHTYARSCKHVVDSIPFTRSNFPAQRLNVAANHRLRMGGIYTKYLDARRDLCGDRMCLFSSVAKSIKLSSWGLDWRGGPNLLAQVCYGRTRESEESALISDRTFTSPDLWAIPKERASLYRGRPLNQRCCFEVVTAPPAQESYPSQSKMSACRRFP